MKTGRFIILFLLGLCALATTTIALLPTFASTNYGTRIIQNQINRHIPGTIHIQNLDLRWGHGQTVKGLILEDPQGQIIAELKEFTTDATLWQLIRRRTQLGLTRIQDLNATIVTDSEGTTNLQRALTYTRTLSHPTQPSTIVLSNVQIILQLLHQDPNPSLILKGETRQGDLKGHFDCMLALKDLKAEDWEQLQEEAHTLLSLEGNPGTFIHGIIVNFPVDILDRLLALKKPKLNGVFRSLFGDRLNLTLNKEPGEHLAFTLSLVSPQIKGHLKGLLDNGVFSLQEPATLHMLLTPELVNPFSIDYFELLKATPAHLQIKNLKIPLSFLGNQAIDPCDLACDLNLESEETAVSTFFFGEMQILNLQTALISKACEKDISIQVRGTGKRDQEPAFEINFDSKLGKPKRWSELVSQLQKNSTAKLEMLQFPILTIEHWLQEPLLTSVLGPVANITVQANYQPNGQLNLEAGIQTSKLNISKAQFSLKETLKLVRPLNFDFIFPSKLLESFSSQTLPFTLSQDTPVSFTIHQLETPLSSIESMKVQAEAWIADLQILDSVSHEMHLENCHLSFRGKSLKEFKTQMTTQIQFKDSHGQSFDILGKSLEINGYADVHLTDSTFPILSSLNIDLISETTRFNFKGKTTQEGIFTLQHPLELNYELTPAIFSQLKEANSLSFDIPSSAHLYLKADFFQMNLRSFDLHSILAKGSISLEKASIQDKNGQKIRIEQLQSAWKIDSPTQQAYLKIEGLAEIIGQEKPSELIANLNVQQWLKNGEFDLNHVKFDVNSHLKGFPTAFLRSFAAMDPVLFLGPKMDIELKSNLDKQLSLPGSLEFNIDSAYFHVSSRFKIDEAITLYNPSKLSTDVRWTLTPQAYQQLRDQNALTADQRQIELIKPLTFKTQITDFYLPLTGTSPLDHARLSAQFTGEAEFQDKGTSAASFPLYVQGYFKSQNMANDFQMQAEALSANKMLMSVQGSISHSIDSAFHFNFNQSDTNLKLELNQFPVYLLSTIPFLDTFPQKMLQVLVGNRVDAKAELQLQKAEGFVKGSVNGDLGHGIFDASVQKGVLKLNQALEYELTVTPEFSRVFFDKNTPFLSSIIRSEQPLKIWVDHKGFQLPIIPFNLEIAQIPQGFVSMGKILFRNEGDVKAILNLVKAVKDDQFTIWFTPIYFQLSKGFAAFKRTDMLIANEYALASWGTIDLPANKVDTVVGISAQALRYAFSVPDLEDNYLLQVDIKGRKGKFKIDYKTAMGRISTLLTQKQGGLKGKILGSVLELAGKGETDPHSPPPTTYPFPWNPLTENEPIASKEEVKQKRQKQSEKTTNDSFSSEGLIKDIEKSASSLLDYFKSK